MKKQIKIQNTKGFSHIELFIIVIVLVAIGGILYYGVSRAATTWSNLASIDLAGQSFAEMACIETVHPNTSDIKAQLTVNRQAGTATYNPLGAVRIATNPIYTNTYDKWNTGSVSTLTFSFSEANNTRFRLGVVGKINGKVITVYGPSYNEGSINHCNAQKSATAISTDIVNWPFATKGASQYQRIDQGWDIQSNANANIYAIAPGVIHQYSPNPGGFGDNYPTELLDYTIGGPSSWVYYGHVHVIPSVVGAHVSIGQLIAHANQYSGQNGSAAPPGWLEIGFAEPGTDVPIAQSEGGGGEGAATAAGTAMHDILINAPVH